MAAPISEEDNELARNRRTLFLLIGGGLSLLVPLAAVLYIRLSDTVRAAKGTVGTSVFERRAADAATAAKITPAVAPAPLAGTGMAPSADTAPRPPSPAPINAEGEPQGGSLSFIRGGDDYYREKAQPQPAPAPTAQPPAPEQPAAQAPAPPPKKAAKPAYKQFSAPKLRPTSGGFADFRNGFNTSGGEQPEQAGEMEQAPGAAPPAAGPAPGKASGPGSGTNLPRLGAMGAKNPSGAAPAMPDIGGMMKNLPAGGQKPGAAMPDISGMLKNLPGSDATQR